jgi:hypothetical protein
MLSGLRSNVKKKQEKCSEKWDQIFIFDISGIK